MNKLKKYCVLGAVFALSATIAGAEITVKDTVSPEFIHNQGYSKEVSRVISVRNIDPMTPIAQEETSKKKRFGLYLWRTLDPAVDNSTRWVNHDINYKRTNTEDL